MTNDDLTLLRDFRAEIPVLDNETRARIYAYATTGTPRAAPLLTRRRVALTLAACVAVAAPAVVFSGLCSPRRIPRSKTKRRSCRVAGDPMGYQPIALDFTRSGQQITSIKVTVNAPIRDATLQLQVLRTHDRVCPACSNAERQVVFKEQVPMTNIASPAEGPPGVVALSTWSGTLSPSNWEGGCQNAFYTVAFESAPLRQPAAQMARSRATLPTSRVVRARESWPGPVFGMTPDRATEAAARLARNGLRHAVRISPTRRTPPSTPPTAASVGSCRAGVRADASVPECRLDDPLHPRRHHLPRVPPELPLLEPARSDHVWGSCAARRVVEPRTTVPGLDEEHPGRPTAVLVDIPAGPSEVVVLELRHGLWRVTCTGARLRVRVRSRGIQVGPPGPRARAADPANLAGLRDHANRPSSLALADAALARATTMTTTAIITRFCIVSHQMLRLGLARCGVRVEEAAADAGGRWGPCGGAWRGHRPGRGAPRQAATLALALPGGVALLHLNMQRNSGWAWGLLG